MAEAESRMLENAKWRDGMPIDKRVKLRRGAGWRSRRGDSLHYRILAARAFPTCSFARCATRGPKNLTLVVNSATHRYSLTHELIANDLVRKVICTAARGHDKEPSPFETRWMAGKIELEMVPQGSFTERIRAGGAGIPAFYTPVGFGTELTQGKEIRRFGDRDYVLEEAIAGDLALVRADTADRTGNLVFNYAQMNFGPVMATAAKLAVAEVRTVSEDLLPRERIQLPGVYVDRVVPRIMKLPLNRLQITWRAAQDIYRRPGGEPRHRPAGALLGLSAPRGRRDPPVGERRDRRRPVGGKGQGRHRPGRCRQPPDHLAAGRLHRGLLVVVRDDPWRAYRRDDPRRIRGRGERRSRELGHARTHRGPLVGGAMDLAACAREVRVIMEHVTRKGAPRLLEKCALPLTAVRCVSRVYTDLAVVDVTPQGFVVREMVAISREELQQQDRRTARRLRRTASRSPRRRSSAGLKSSWPGLSRDPSGKS